MRILLAPDHFGGTLSATQAVAALTRGWAVRGDDEVTGRAMSDGSVGLVDVVHAARGGELMSLTVPGALGAPMPASVLHVPGRGGGTAFVEAGQVLGTPARGRDDHLASARDGSSAGAADLVAVALATGARRVVVGVGHVLTHDAGAGFLRALHERLVGGRAPTQVWRSIPALREALAGTELLVAAATDIPLLGLHGAGAALANRDGIDPATAQDIEGSMAELVVAAEAMVAGLPPVRVLLLGADAEPTRRASRLDHSGAGGGLGFALALLGARLMSGAEVVAAEVGLAEAVAAADLVVTGGEALDGDALHDGVVATVGRLAMASGIPVVAVAHELYVNRRELAQVGVSGSYQVLDTRLSHTPGAAEPEPLVPAEALAARGARIARTWSP
ncbi:MAG: glycerate kinase [Actinomycetales bacterium]|nr:glycerate kinase [Actinomycetales bacterium]